MSDSIDRRFAVEVGGSGAWEWDTNDKVCLGYQLLAASLDLLLFIQELGSAVFTAVQILLVKVIRRETVVELIPKTGGVGTGVTQSYGLFLVP